ncbi:E3 ISG15--protein ligase HERC5 [Varanus komodoensis]|nr:E3 ISG15--protein ligase HERC5 [Varanus komodoensis]
MHWCLSEWEQIQALETTVIVHISCGKEHSVALSNSGNVFAWGAGASGQLGTGELKASFIPKKINDLSRIIQIACGHNHTVALSEDGRVFSWGQNTHGQLGLGEDISSREKPQQVSTLDGIPLAQVAAGGTHSFALSLSGVVYAWGRNHAGQLGLSQTNPKGKSAFKFAHAGVNGSVFTFGDNSAGQLGHSSSARKAGPQRVDGIDGPVSHLACGREVKAIFSSPPCLTASFLRPRSSLERYDDIAVDLQKARATFEELAKKEWISRMITDSLINSLIPALPLNSLHKEAFSVFLLLAECMEALSLQLRPECMIGFLESSNVQSLGVHFAKAVTGLHKRSSVILEEYWSLLPESFLDRIVQMIKKAVLAQLCFYRTCSQYQEVIPPLEVLKRLYKVNKVAANKLPVSNFYIDEIYRRINVLTDVQRWNARAEGVLNENAVCLCYFPFVFSPVTKKQIFYWYSSVVQRIIEEKGILAVQNYSQQKQSELPKPTRLFLKVRRHNLVEDALYKLSQVEDSCLRKLLVIQFEGEMPVYEAGSILSEFFLLVFEKMIRPEYKMFMYSEKNSPVWFPPRPSLDKSKYFLFGVLCGLCMFNRVIAYVPFPLATFKKLVGKKPSLDDLKELSPAIGKSLQEILDYEHEDIEEKLQTCYSISWDNVVVDLIQNGSAITVNNKNKKKFVAKYVDYVFNTSVEEIFKEFRRGFYKVVGESIAGFFEPQELMDVMIGNTSYDWNAYEKVDRGARGNGQEKDSLGLLSAGCATALSLSQEDSCLCHGVGKRKQEGSQTSAKGDLSPQAVATTESHQTLERPFSFLLLSALSTFPPSCAVLSVSAWGQSPLPFSAEAEQSPGTRVLLWLLPKGGSRSVALGLGEESAQGEGEHTAGLQVQSRRSMVLKLRPTGQMWPAMPIYPAHLGGFGLPCVGTW